MHQNQFYCIEYIFDDKNNLIKTEFLVNKNNVNLKNWKIDFIFK